MKRQGKGKEGKAAAASCPGEKPGSEGGKRRKRDTATSAAAAAAEAPPPCPLDSDDSDSDDGDRDESDDDEKGGIKLTGALSDDGVSGASSDTSGDDLECTFAFYDPNESHFWGIKTLLRRCA